MPKEFRGGFSAISIIVLIVILTIFIVGGFFGYQYFQLQNIQEGAKVPAVEPPTPSAKIQPQTTEIDTSNWKTYRNEVYGFEVRHPANWSVIRENKDMSLQNALKRFGGDKAEVVVLDEKSGRNVTVLYLGTNLNFSDCPSKISQEECLKLRETNKMDLDQFMGLGVFQNTKKTLLNGYNAYEIGSENAFVIMVENKGEVFQIYFADHSTKNDLSPAEFQVLSTFKFIK